MADALSHLIAFLSGALVGASGKYLGDKYTDQRRRQEARQEVKSRFHAVQKQMPELIAEMRQDQADPENKSVRRLFISPSKSVSLNLAARALVYYEDEHTDLRGKVTILENHGYVIDDTTGNVPRYRIAEEFVELLRRG